MCKVFHIRSTYELVLQPRTAAAIPSSATSSMQMISCHHVITLMGEQNLHNSSVGNSPRGDTLKKNPFRSHKDKIEYNAFILNPKYHLHKIKSFQQATSSFSLLSSLGPHLYYFVRIT